MPWHPAGGLRGHGLSSVCVYTLKCGFLLVINRLFGWKIVVIRLGLSGGCSPGVAVALRVRLLDPGSVRGDDRVAPVWVCHRFVTRACNPTWFVHGAGFDVWFRLVYLVCVGPRLDVGLLMEKILLVDDYSFITG